MTSTISGVRLVGRPEQRRLDRCGKRLGPVLRFIMGAFGISPPPTGDDGRSGGLHDESRGDACHPTHGGVAEG